MPASTVGFVEVFMGYTSLSIWLEVGDDVARGDWPVVARVTVEDVEVRFGVDVVLSGAGMGADDVEVEARDNQV